MKWSMGPSAAAPDPDAQAMHAVRIAAAGTMVIHGIARVALGGVVPFGGFLSQQQHLPFGVAIAWVLTVVEIAGGLVLAAGFARRCLALWFAAQLAVGIAMVHASSGWFVVGAGRNGAEYNVVLIVCFLAVAWAGRPARR